MTFSTRRPAVPALFWGALAALLFTAGCTCGPGGVGAGCRTPRECGAELICAGNGTCQQVGSTVGLLPDGGRSVASEGCVNLSCQQVTCKAAGATTTVKGHVFDPTGTLPLYNAIVYVPNGAVQPFPTGVTCDRCGSLATGSPLVTAQSGPDGAFTLTNVPAGKDIPLVLQLGKFRRQVRIPAVNACVTTEVTDVELLRLPRSRSEGDLPQLAIATGSADPFECLLLKLGLSPSEFTAPSESGAVHLYRSNGSDLVPAVPAASALWSDAGTLGRYDVVLLPCEGTEVKKPLEATQNIIDYTSAGGRVFATHYSYVWTAFAQAPFPSTAQWEPDVPQAHNPPSPFGVSVDTSFPKGQALLQWLGTVNALDSGLLYVIQARDDVTAVNAAAGTTRWLYGTVPTATNPNSVQELTFNTPISPAPLADGGAGNQCGRVVFSDFHVTTDAVTDGGIFPLNCRPGPLTSQEKALLFMLFDVTSCVQSDTEVPVGACRAVGNSCSPGNGCCAGLTCVDKNFDACTGGNAPCSCEPTVN